VLGGLAAGGAAAFVGLHAARWIGAERLRGRVVVITGGSRGLGLALAREFAAEGCRLALCARDELELTRAQVELERTGAEVFAQRCNVADRNQVEAFAAAIVARFGAIDLVVNNAGVVQVGPFDTMTLIDFGQAMNINFWGPLNVIWAVLPYMREQGSGHIVNVTSIGGKIAVPHLLPYTCAKFAAVGLSEGLRAELADDGITVTTVVPGLMRTGSFLHAEFGGDRDAEYRWFALDSSAPYPIAVNAERAARLIVRAAKRGDVECTFPLSALLAARATGLAPAATAEVLELVDRLMPAPTARPAEFEPGRAVVADVDSPVLRAATTLGWNAARDHNEMPPGAAGATPGQGPVA
jgi:NAD(P)-dependent dehydrogenase (short-subunit alcohol dehydrogenase family)